VRLALGTFVGAVAFRGDGAALAIALGDSEGDDDARLEVRALPAGELLHRAPLPSYAFATAWTPADDAVVVACADYAAYVVGVPRAESGAALASDGARDPVPSGDADADVRRRPTAPEIVLRGHRAEVVGLALSPAGGVAATSSWDQTMRLWELADGQELVRLPAQALGFSRDGRRVAYRTIDAFQVAEVVHGRVLHTLHGHAGKAPGAVAFSRDGALLASYGDDGAMLWDTATWGPLGRLAPTDADGVEFAPDGDTFYLSWDGGLERRRVSAPFEPGELLLAGDQDHCDLSADGTLLAVRAGDALQLLDASGPGAPRLTRTIPGFPGFEYVSVGARGTYVAGETWKGPGLSVWRASDGALLGRLREDRSALGAAIAPDETRLVVGDGIGYEVYALPGLERVHVIERDVAMRESPGTIAFSADGAVLALGLTDDVVGLFDGRTYAPLARLESRGAALDGRAELSPDGSLLAVSSLSNRVCVWDLPELRRELAAAGIAWE
jgi:WD40 repeat protein